MKTLLIYIPTYNRAECLTAQINALYSEPLPPNITVIVSDNNSTEQAYTTGEIEKICNGKGIQYIKNTCNIGANPNILNGFIKGEGYDYLWILSDDDTLFKHRVKMIVNTLEKSESDFILFHQSRTGVECHSELEEIIDEGLGLISNVIYKTEFVKNHITFGYEYLISCFPHLAILLASSIDKPYVQIDLIEKNLYFPERVENIKYPEGLTGYRKSFYGFLMLANILDNRRRKKFVNMWYRQKYNRYAAVKYRKLPLPQIPIWRSIIRKNLGFYLLKYIFTYMSYPLVSVAHSILVAARNSKR